jgi:hypothetical protein
MHDEQHEERERECLDHKSSTISYSRAESVIKADTHLYEKCRDVANNKVLGYFFRFHPRVASLHAVYNETPVQYVIEGEVCSRR